MPGSLIVSMGVSVDGFIQDRDGRFDWSVPSDEQFAFHLEQVRGLGGVVLGRRLYESMVVWETDPSFLQTEQDHAFAAAWSALPKVVFSRTLDRVAGHARLASRSLADEVRDMVSSTEKDVEIGGADLAGQAIQLGLVDEFCLFRSPIIVGGGTPLLPPVADAVRLELVETRTFASRVLYERYRRAR